MDSTSPERQRDFLSQCYFDTEKPDIDSFLSRAYLDMCRTFRGIAALDTGREITDNARGLLKNHFQCLQKRDASGNLFDTFDGWHRDTVSALKAHYEDTLKDHPDVCMTVGQAQKWINMTMKYCWVCGGTDLQQKLLPWFAVAHIPVDSIVLDIAKQHDITYPQAPWSKWNDYDQYLVFQQDVRTVATGQPVSPLELEYIWWSNNRQQAPGARVHVAWFAKTI